MSTASVRDLDLLVSDLFQGSLKSRTLGWLGWGLAFALHATVLGLAFQHHTAHAEKERPPLDVELLAPPPPPEPVPVQPAAPEPEPKAVVHASPRVAAAPPPAPAQAGALHTAKDDASSPNADDPLDFTHDQSVTGFGAGVVAIGGTASFAPKGAAPAPVQAAKPSAAAPSGGEALTAAADLGRKPVLGETDPCRGYFPRDALDDVATASVLVVVGKSGAVSKVSVVSESPASQGFGNAARACMSTKHFTPALDREGRPTATAIRVNVRFAR